MMVRKEDDRPQMSDTLRLFNSAALVNEMVSERFSPLATIRRYLDTHCPLSSQPRLVLGDGTFPPSYDHA